ncbi:MAG: AAC(3) family N-acetyltransferase [Candidatus Kapabacteria bacterium]|nr:AAC(3) family N-acetyltransferase [Candidatus Kapabacteria bacterium]
MFYKIKPYIKKIVPDDLYKKVRNYYFTYKKSRIPVTTEAQFRSLLVNDLGIKNGQVVFIHSSLNSFNFDFSSLSILNILIDTVGPEGTLLFPCHQYTETSTYEIKNKIPINLSKTRSDVGLLPEFARRYSNSYRSLHPTNSIVAIGKYAKELTEEHHLDIYPCGEKSPYYKIMQYDGIIVGLGVGIECLTFVHVVEDIMKDKFPVITRESEIYKAKVIDKNKNEVLVDTLIANENAGMRDLITYFTKYIPSGICKLINKNRTKFFSINTKLLFSKMIENSKNGITLYQRGAYTKSNEILKRDPNYFGLINNYYQGYQLAINN